MSKLKPWETAALKPWEAAALDEKEAPSEEPNSFIVDQAIRGGFDFISGLFPDVFKDRPLSSKTDYSQFQNADGTIRVAEMEQYINERDDVSAAELFGYQGVESDNLTEQLMGQTARSLVSEGPMVVMGASKKIPSVLSEVAFSGLSTLTGVAAQTVVSEAGKKWELPTLATEILGTVAGSVASVGASATRGALGGAIDNVRNAKVNKKYVSDNVDKATDFVVADEMNTVIEKAIQTQPDIESVITSVKELEGIIPGLTVPPAAALADNPIFKKNTEQLLRTDPTFFASAKKSLKDAKEAIDAHKTSLFGDASPATDKKIRESLPKNFTGRIRGAERKIQQTQNKIDRLIEKVVPKTDTVAVGQAIDKLMTQKQQHVRDKLSPKYAALLNKTDASLTLMSPNGVMRVSRMADLLKASDNFASFPQLMDKIRTEWRPSEGTPFQKGVEYPEVSAREVDSLKRAINKAIRQTKDTDKLRMLNALKTELKTSIAKDMPKSFSEPYSALDLQYYTELGIPMSKQGVRQLDSTRFASQAGAYLSRPEQAADFLGFVGEAGVPVVRDAIMLKMDKAAIRKDGSIDVANVVKFLKQNARLVEQVPGLASELNSIASVVDNLSSTKARMDAEYSVRSKELVDGFLKGMHNKKLSGVVNEILASPKSSEIYLRDLKNFDGETQKMIKQGVRAQIIENGINKSNMSMVEFIQANKNIMDQWFGSTYVKDVEALALASDQLNKVDLDKMKFALDYKNADTLSNKIGIPFAQLQSILRDRIAGAGTKAAIIASKISTSKIQDKKNSQMTELLLNPDALKSIREASEGTKGGFSLFNPSLLESMATAINNSVTKGIYFGIAGAEEEQQRQAQLPVADIPQDPTFDPMVLEGFDRTDPSTWYNKR